ncbi:hypothetical protein C823_002416 [Eubacterium plexicaudatum ASF492]|uniref:Glycosyltransferase RgtA/B/C/D-like domain-containing protein n=1 Tax=Eubacterium plexicaudatum ASF492 TaxID=1235802 RepID=N2BMK6_9FIRM|nr:hypothetical protein C823_002416 [Eubacterium plexicaudatum ASF492]
MLKSNRNYVKRCLKIGLIIFCFAIGIKFIAFSLPKDRVRNHISESYKMLKEEGVYPQTSYLTDDIYLKQQLDNHTDAIYLNVAYTVRPQNALKYVAGDFYGNKGGNPIEQLGNQIADEGSSDTVMYGRQWFGAAGIIRILLYFFNLSQIRALSSVLLLALLFLVGVKLKERVGKQFAYVFVLAVLLFFPSTIALSMNIANVFYVSFFSIYYIVGKNKHHVDAFVDLFVVGCLTAYFDLFLTPFVSYGLVTTVMIMMLYHNHTIDSFCSGAIQLMKIASGWLTGYIGFWSLKWVFASIVLKQNVFANVLSEMKNVGGGTVSWGPDSKLGYIKSALELNFNKMLPVQVFQWIKNEVGFAVYPLFMLLLITTLVVLFVKKHKPVAQMYISLLFIIIGMMPYVYYMIMHIHTFVHYWIEYRYQCMTVISFTMAYLTSLRMSKDT